MCILQTVALSTNPISLAPVEQKVSAPWLRKRNEKINVVDLDRRIERPTTPEEIETVVANRKTRGIRVGPPKLQY